MHLLIHSYTYLSLLSFPYIHSKMLAIYKQQTHIRSKEVTKITTIYKLLNQIKMLWFNVCIANLQKVEKSVSQLSDINSISFISYCDKVIAGTCDFCEGEKIWVKYISYQLSEHRSVRNSTNMQYTINLLFAVAIRSCKLHLHEFRKYLSNKFILIFIK